MNTILVPVDYSEAARHAFIYSIDLAILTKANLVLFHAFQQAIPVGMAFREQEAILMLEKEKEKKMKAWSDEVKKEIHQGSCWQFTSTLGNDFAERTSLNLTRSGFHTIENIPENAESVKISFICKFGEAGEEINIAAKKCQADLVLLSSSGAGGLGQALLGSTVVAVINSCQVPVLTLPQLAEFKSQNTFVFASDLNQLEDNSFLDLLRTLVKAFRADLKIVHIYEQKEFSSEQKKALKGLDTLDIYLADLSYRVYFRQSNNILTGIYDFVQQQHANLLVLVPKQHSFLKTLLNKTLIGKITKQGLLPFISLPLPSK